MLEVTDERLRSIPCEFLVSLAPHGRAVLYLALHHAPFLVALVGGAGTLVAETVNYQLLRYCYPVLPVTWLPNPRRMLAPTAPPAWP